MTFASIGYFYIAKIVFSAKQGVSFSVSLIQNSYINKHIVYIMSFHYIRRKSKGEVFFLYSFYTYTYTGAEICRIVTFRVISFLA